MSNSKAQARREHLARIRAAQKRKERRTSILMWGTGGVIGVLLVGSVAWYLVDQNAQTSLDAVKSYSYTGSQHTPVKVAYKETPPVGGEHHGTWQRCAVYDKPVNNEHAVHSMEHGAVWITYRPGLAQPQLDRLKELASDDYLLLSPYPGLPAPVVASSWNKQLTFQDANDPKLPKFISTYKNGPETPELGAACDGPNSTDATADVAPIPAAPAQSGQPSAPATPSAPAEES
ncbi:hypothetical protein Misp01_23220 [Microtetraspora sp. NBRC 13810]|uniref:DUF3105 domain-containing protein n=1 Tax=Microtetraspora sp. NBRC 13810 TaxID=3030990 RepID=UPI0024A2240B|nr:DUF3105 domain-containing protein [Microtetraspora sp. NBRC 13810]GLW07192.1 hypothetical protein Misp01_23220 [Microtetraspora sp. NBRC 13810]